jgi:hypothetical protein
VHLAKRKWDSHLQSDEPTALVGTSVPDSLRSAVFTLHSILLFVFAKITETTRTELDDRIRSMCQKFFFFRLKWRLILPSKEVAPRPKAEPV